MCTDFGGSRCCRVSGHAYWDELLRSLDYPSKLTPQPGHIDRLIADGVAQAKAFLAELETELAPPEPSAARAVLGDAALH